MADKKTRTFNFQGKDELKFKWGVIIPSYAFRRIARTAIKEYMETIGKGKVIFGNITNEELLKSIKRVKRGTDTQT